MNGHDPHDRDDTEPPSTGRVDETGRTDDTATTLGPDRATGARVRTTERAVSPVIGAILMFALALALLAVLQLTAVPAMNEGLEFQHSERVGADVSDVDAAVERVAATGTGETVSIEAGLRYPPRMFFVNPPPVSGTVRTTDPAAVTIGNASASGETGDYWNGTDRTFETRSLEYVPDYNEYDGGPTTVSEPWVVYDRFPETVRVETEQDLVDGRRIDLVALEGERSVSRTGEVALDIDPSSAPTETVTVRGDGDPIALTIPTRLDEDEWRDLLADELDSGDGDGSGDSDGYVTAIDCERAPPDPCGRLTLTLERGATYELRLGAVAVGSGATEAEAAYLTDVEGNATAVPEDGRQRLVVEARDRFDNPVSGVRLSGTVEGEGDGSVRAVDPVTDAEGRATFVYDAPADVDASRDVEATLRFGDGAPRSVTYDVRVMDRDGGRSDGDGSSDSSAAPNATITDVSANTGGNQDRYDVSLEATDADGNLDAVEFELRNPDTGDAVDVATATLDGDRDAATERLRARGDRRLAEYRVVVRVVDADGQTGRDAATVAGSGS